MGPTSETGSGPPTSRLKKTDTDNKKAKPVLCQSQIIQQLYTFSSLPHACCVHIQLTMKCMVCATVTSSWASFVMLLSKISELKTKWPFALVKSSPSFFAKQVYSLFYWSAATSLPFLLTTVSDEEVWQSFWVSQIRWLTGSHSPQKLQDNRYGSTEATKHFIPCTFLQLKWTIWRFWEVRGFTYSGPAVCWTLHLWGFV